MSADSFQGSGTINLQRGTSNVPYRFKLTVATSSNKNDGALPWGSTLASFTIKAYPIGSTISSTQILVTKSQSSNEMIARMTWTTQVNPGIYRLEFKVTASVTGSTLIPMKRQFDFARVYLKERK